MQTKELHVYLDTNNDGHVDNNEFVTGMVKLIPSLQAKAFNDIFRSIDLNGDNSLSLNEFSLFLKSASLQRE